MNLKGAVGAAVIVSMMLASEAAAQLAAPNAAGVAMGHVHYWVKDVEAHVRFWTALGGRLVRPLGDTQAVQLTDVLVLLSRGETQGGSDGSVVNHVAFRVPTFASVEARGLTVQRLDRFPGVGFTTSPEGERIELFEDAATNLTFTQDSGTPDAVAARHGRPVGAAIAFHHVHLYVPADAVAAAKAWYVRLFGGVPGKRSTYDAVDLPGININISAAPNPAVPTRGRMLDHIGFEITGLDAFVARLRSMGATIQAPYARDANGVGTATIVDPWGTTIELTEGLRRN